MSHQRKVIRDAVVVALMNHTSAGPRVYPTRTYPIDEASFPAICVYTLTESSELDGMGGSERSLARNLDLVIEAIAKVNEVLDDTLDQLALEIETVIGSNRKLGGNAYDSRLQSTAIAVRGEGEKETGSAVLTFAVGYRTFAADPSVNSI